MNIVRTYATRPASEADLSSLEQRLGFGLPEEYRAFLLRTNGGEPDADTFEFVTMAGKPEETSVRAFLSLDEADAAYSITRYLSFYEGWLPPAVIPIAVDFFNNLILLDLGDGRRGAVLYWDCVGEPTVDPSANVTAIAESFELFISRLTEF